MHEETPLRDEWLSQCCRESILICYLYFTEDFCCSLWFSNILSSLICWIFFIHKAVWNLARTQLVNVWFALRKTWLQPAKQVWKIWLSTQPVTTNHTGSSCFISVGMFTLWSQKSLDARVYIGILRCTLRLEVDVILTEASQAVH